MHPEVTTISALAGRMDALNKPSTQEFARGRWPASFEEECLSATDPAETGVAGRQSARTQQDTWCEVDCLGAADGARTSCARAGDDR